MIVSNELNFVKDVLKNMPADWLGKTTHRLDIYNEKFAKVDFLEKFEDLFKAGKSDQLTLSELPTAFDYIRLGHPLSCVLEWVMGKLNRLESQNVISFSSKTMPVLAILRKNLLENRNTQITYINELPKFLNIETLKEVYGYKFSLKKISSLDEISEESTDKISDFEGSTVFVSDETDFNSINLVPGIDFFVSLHPVFGSVILVNGEKNESHIAEIQHVRRRESIAMTPADSFSALHYLIDKASYKTADSSQAKKNIENKNLVLNSIKKVTGTNTKALLGSCGLSVQYAIMMGLIDDSQKKHKDKKIKFVVPTNCYGGTNDQARRVAACLEHVEVVDLAVDGGKDMVESIDMVLTQIASDDAVPYIIAEIPTNPRVEVPDLVKLNTVLAQKRKTKNGATAVDPVFILDQTFCPNVHFLGEADILSEVRTISYVSGSKFPSGGLCTAGYCVSNKKSENLMDAIEKQLKLCDNEATDLQVEILSKQMPSMNERIAGAYKNTRNFVDYIVETLPGAKINFVSHDLADAGFTPSVFSLDLPTKGDSIEAKEAHKRELNHKLINMMIKQIPEESQHCVSYGQLKGCYWTIPATSTQGTTKEGDKDYIVRVAASPNMDVEKHKKVFLDFVKEI